MRRLQSLRHRCQVLAPRPGRLVRVVCYRRSLTSTSSVYVDDGLLAAGGCHKERSHTFTASPFSVGDFGTSVAIPKDTLDAPAPPGRPGSFEPQLHNRKIFGHSPESFRLVADMVRALRPFVEVVWTALASSCRLPLDLVHCRHFLVALWFLALFSVSSWSQHRGLRGELS